MTQQLRILNGKEIKEINAHLHEQFGFTGKIDSAVLRSDKHEKLFLFSRDLEMVDLQKLRIDMMGLYVAATFKGQIRLTIEGTQLFGAQCTKNILELSPWEMQLWMAGLKLKVPQLELPQKEITPGAFVIMRCGNDYLGCGKIAGELILNYIPKTRHIHALYEVYDDAVSSEEGAESTSEEIEENNEEEKDL